MSTEFDKIKLTKLSKSELIKKCKSCKLPTNGTKSDLIERLITNHVKGIVKYIKLRARPKGISIANYSEYLVHGLVKKYRSKSNSNRIFPSSLITLIIQFVSEHFDPYLKFDICSYKYIDDITKNGTFIDRGIHYDTGKKGKRIIYGCSNGYKTGIHVWRIKVFQSHNWDDFIGITNKLYLCDKRLAQQIKDTKYVSNNAEYSYSICSNGQVKSDLVRSIGKRINMYGYRWKTPQEQQEKTRRRFINGDIICVQLNLDKMYVRFYINDKKIGMKRISKQDTYYPIIVSSSNDTQFELV